MPENLTPRELGYRWPAEWEEHAATWLSWPHNLNTWPGNFEPIPAVFAKFAQTIALFEPVHILVPEHAHPIAMSLVGETSGITLHVVPTNDCWIRDSGPWTLQHAEKPSLIVNWEYNAWGGKYPPFDADNAIPSYVAQNLNLECYSPGIIMEGGSVENNGMGDLLVTSQCLLNPNRNPGLSRIEITQSLLDATGAQQIHWLMDVDDGSIAGDDTDAHIDQLARFAASDLILAIKADPSDEEHFPLLDKLHRELAELQDVDGSPFKIRSLPLPKPVIYDGHRLPASYANFYIGNGFVVVPTFRCPQDEEAISILQKSFPEREVIGIDAVEFVWGLGAFHCSSMQQGV